MTDDKSKVEVLYRYREEQIDGFGDTRPVYAVHSMRLYLDTYRVIKHTPCGVWIVRGYDGKKFVNLDATRKWAHPSKEDAMKSFIARKKRQVQILKNQLTCAEAALLLKAEDASGRVSGGYQFQVEPYESF